MRTVLALVGLLVLTGCTTFREDHYFQSLNVKDQRATNYFRLRVEGYAMFSRARYLAGYYDERAVDIFFNEMKTTEMPPLFPANLTEPGTDVRITPLTPATQRGSFLMILSTNAKAVADAIGQFAENQVAAAAITNLVNRGDILEARRSEARLAARTAAASAVAAELQALMTAVPDAADGDANKQATEQAYVRVLNALARAAGGTSVFTSLDDAAPFFDALAAGRP